MTQQDLATDGNLMTNLEKFPAKYLSLLRESKQTALLPDLQDFIDHHRRITMLAQDRALRAMLCKWVSGEEPQIVYDRQHRLVGLAARDRIVIRLEQPV